LQAELAIGLLGYAKNNLCFGGLYANLPHCRLYIDTRWSELSVVCWTDAFQLQKYWRDKLLSLPTDTITDQLNVDFLCNLLQICTLIFRR